MLTEYGGSLGHVMQETKENPVIYKIPKDTPLIMSASVLTP